MILQKLGNFVVLCRILQNLEELFSFMLLVPSPSAAEFESPSPGRSEPCRVPWTVASRIDTVGGCQGEISLEIIQLSFL